MSPPSRLNAISPAWCVDIRPRLRGGTTLGARRNDVSRSRAGNWKWAMPFRVLLGVAMGTSDANQGTIANDGVASTPRRRRVDFGGPVAELAAHDHRAPIIARTLLVLKRRWIGRTLTHPHGLEAFDHLLEAPNFHGLLTDFFEELGLRAVRGLSNLGECVGVRLDFGRALRHE